MEPLDIRRYWAPPPSIPEDGKMCMPWRPVGESWTVNIKVPTVVNGFGRTIETQDLPLHRRIERRAVYQFVGYEERVVES